MIPAVAISGGTVALMIGCVLFFPKLKLGKFTISTYWIVTLLGAFILLVSGVADAAQVAAQLTENSAINPLKILTLFLSMTLLSVFLDELGFFRYLANAALKLARGGQRRLFLLLYLTVSILTVFTSNDVIILSFTPFILYFSKNAGIDPIPYLAAEFVAANTWSMALIIGNPTNIYLATACGLNFVPYLKISLLPTIFAGITAFIALWLVFFKRLKMPITLTAEEVVIKDKPLLMIGALHLLVCTILLAVGSYLGLEMWMVSLCSAVSLALFNLIFSIFRKRAPKEFCKSFCRIPFELIPFLLSMFVMIVALSDVGVTDALFGLLSGRFSVFRYGFASFFAANIINNIPMSVLFSSILKADPSLGSVFATVIGSNLGAFFTPVGALAGIMFSSMLNKQGIKFGYFQFLKLGVTVGIPTLLASLLGLLLVL